MYENRQNYECSNKVVLTGEVLDEPIFSHEVFGESFYAVTLKVKRLSEVYDILPLTVSERLTCAFPIFKGMQMTVKGQLRSYNKPVEGKSKLLLSVFVRELFEADNTINPNNIELDGYLCKTPIFRTTPFAREICDLLLAVNRAYNKSDYIPAIAWGRNARFVKYLSIGQQVSISGRLQSRDYQKKIGETEVVTKTAYEVSVNKICISNNDFSDQTLQRTVGEETDNNYALSLT